MNFINRNIRLWSIILLDIIKKKTEAIPDNKTTRKPVSKIELKLIAFNFFSSQEKPSFSG